MPSGITCRDRRNNQTIAILLIDEWIVLNCIVFKCSGFFSLTQAPKKAKKRSEGANSNVFSMFEQAQIQEFKEVSVHSFNVNIRII